MRVIPVRAVSPIDRENLWLISDNRDNSLHSIHQYRAISPGKRAPRRSNGVMNYAQILCMRRQEWQTIRYRLRDDTAIVVTRQRPRLEQIAGQIPSQDYRYPARIHSNTYVRWIFLARGPTRAQIVRARNDFPNIYLQSWLIDTRHWFVRLKLSLFLVHNEILHSRE